MHGVDESRVQLWIDALRSGEFKQGQGYLQKDVHLGETVEEDRLETRYCCLGVAQHVAARNGFNEIAVEDLDWGCSSMNQKVGDWFGFPDGNPSDPYLGVHDVPDPEKSDEYNREPVYCIQANDDLGWTFERIADALEAEYLTPTDTLTGSHAHG